MSKVSITGVTMLKKDLPTKAEIDQWRQTALDAGISLDELYVLSMRKYVADFHFHVKGTIQDFLKNEIPDTNKVRRVTTDPMVVILQDKVEYAASRFESLLEQLKELLKQGIEVCPAIPPLVEEGGALIDALNKGLPDTLTFAICTIELHEVAIELEYHMFHEEYEEEGGVLTEDGLDDVRSSLESVLGIDYHPEVGEDR